jgi:K319L-like, PKD domain
MRNIKLVFFMVMAVLLGLYGNVHAVSSWGCDCSTSGCHSSRPSQCEPPPPVNSAPLANAGPNQSVDEESSVTLNGANSSDPDNNIAFYYWEQIDGPVVELSDYNAISPTFVAPAVDLNGISLTFRLTVTDHEAAEGTDTCIVNVSWVNEAPIADAGAEQTVDEGTEVTLDGSNSSDPDDGIASYLWKEVGQPSVTLSDENAARPTFTAPVVNQDSISLTFELTVTDNGGLKATDTSVVNVSWVNEAPTASAGPDQTVNEGDVVTLDASNSNDPDDGIASYMWTQTGAISGVSITFSDPTVAKPTFEAPVVGAEGASLTFQVTVTDNEGLQATDTCIVNINAIHVPPANEAPTADAGVDQTVDGGVLVTLDASNSNDVDDGIASYLWTQVGTVSGVSATLSDPTAVQPTFEAPSVGAPGASLTFQVTVTDIGGLQSTDTCIVNINAVDNTPVNQAPTADAGADQTVDEGDQVVLDGSNSSDPDGVVATYLWKQTGGMSVTLSNPADAQPMFEAPVVDQVSASLTFQITIMDNGGLQSSDTCVVTVNMLDITIEENPTPIPCDDDDDDCDDDDEEDDDRRRRYRRDGDEEDDDDRRRRYRRDGDEEDDDDRRRRYRRDDDEENDDDRRRRYRRDDDEENDDDRRRRYNRDDDDRRGRYNLRGRYDRRLRFDRDDD